LIWIDSWNVPGIFTEHICWLCSFVTLSTEFNLYHIHHQNLLSRFLFIFNGSFSSSSSEWFIDLWFDFNLFSMWFIPINNRFIFNLWIRSIHNLSVTVHCDEVQNAGISMSSIYWVRSGELEKKMPLLCLETNGGGCVLIISHQMHNKIGSELWYYFPLKHCVLRWYSFQLLLLLCLCWDGSLFGHFLYENEPNIWEISVWQ